MTTTKPTGRKPRITVSDIDYRRLIGLADVARAHTPIVADELEGEMDRARVVSAGVIADDVVQMGSTVTFTVDDGAERSATLVYPADADITLGRISVLTPIGAALIGLSPGQSIDWSSPDGRDHTLTVVGVRPPHHTGPASAA